jgi:GNAT superfamily N-acetyltransferase
VRLASRGDAKACRMLLPEFAVEADWFVAVDGAHRLVVGAAAAVRAPRTSPRVGPGVAVHVIAPCRGYGIEAALLEELEKTARRSGAQALYAAHRVEFEGDQMRAWQTLGFEVCETVEEHELPLAPIVARLTPLVDRIRNRGGIPPEARIAPLYAASPGEVLQLHLDHLGGDRKTLYEKIRGQGAGAFHPRYSRVLTLGERVAGAILGHRKSRRVMAVDADIVVPELRGGWANAWLKLEATQGALALGITHFHFTSFDHYADTRAFTGKLGGMTTKKWALMWRPLAR